jgi:hypothetical protein
MVLHTTPAEAFEIEMIEGREVGRIAVQEIVP